jgi:hypothetical protein
MPGTEVTLQAYCLREIVTGVGILASGEAKAWIWGRVGGDALDVATLGGGFAGANPRKANVGLALTAVMDVTLLDLARAAGLSASSGEKRGDLRTSYG